jgi:hypothetical protein
MQPQSEDRARLLRRLALVVDGSRPDYIREAAGAAVQRMLSPGNPLRSKTAAELLSEIKQPWETKAVRNQWGRYEQRPVCRPLPESPADVW